jgi:hypothetical protein
MLLGIFIVTAVLLSPFLGIFIAAAHVSFIGQPQQQIAVARQLGSTTANQGRGRALVHVVDEPVSY